MTLANLNSTKVLITCLKQSIFAFTKVKKTKLKSEDDNAVIILRKRNRMLGLP